MLSQDEVWSHILQKLEESTSKTVLRTWFSDIQILQFTADTMVLYSPAGFKRDIIVKRYISPIKDILKTLLSVDYTVTVLAEDELDEYLAKNEPPAVMPDRTEFVFERFVVGSSNKFAHAAALAVAESPGASYNPLLIYGDSGLGKTHLLYAIKNQILQRNPKFNVIDITAEQFTRELVTAIRIGKNYEFHEKYRKPDLLLVDDIHFISRTDFAQEEFFHTFNALFQAGRQIVLTSDRPPKEMTRLEDRLKTRFEWGLISDIKPPDFETRMAIIKVKAFRLGLDLPDEVAEYIADTVTSNVRQLEGCVKKMMAYQELMRGEISLDTAKMALSDMVRDNPGLAPTPSLILNEICSYFNLEASDILSNNRRSDLVEARQSAMYIVRKLTDSSLHEIGKFFRRDHTTVLHAHDRVETRRQNDTSFNTDIQTLIENIKNK